MKDKLSFKRHHIARTIFVLFNITFLTFLLVAVIFPVLKVLVDSFDESASILEFRMWPKTFTLKAYIWVFTLRWLYMPFLISCIVTTLGTITAMFLTTTFAYVLTKRDMPGRNIMMYMTLFTMIFSGGLIPIFLVVRGIGIYNTIFALILPQAISTYYVILLRNFFSGISPSIIESAELEGCTPLQIFYKIVLPLSKASLAAIGLFYIVQYWNDFFSYVIYINNASLFNYQYMLRQMVLQAETQSGWEYSIPQNTLQSAAIFVGILPVMIIYPLLQKHFVKGIQLGAIKE